MPRAIIRGMQRGLERDIRGQAGPSAIRGGGKREMCGQRWGRSIGHEQIIDVSQQKAFSSL